MHINFELYKYQFAGGELELGVAPLKSDVALETVMIEDYLWHDKFNFLAKDTVTYNREYMWVPYPGGVVTVFKLGYQRHTKEEKSQWSLKKKMDFPHCVVVISHQEPSPYILIWGYDKAFKSAGEVANLLENALNKSFKGRGISISLSPSGKDDVEANHWMDYMLKTYQKASELKNTTIRKLKNYDSIKRRKTSADFRSCIPNPEKADIIISTIRKYMKGKTEPRDIFLPIAAAIVAKVIRRPSWPEASSEFQLSDKLESSFHRLTRVHCKTYQDSAFDNMVEKFRAL